MDGSFVVSIALADTFFDFYCPSERLGIELDGQVHFNELAVMYDQERKLFLEHFAIKIIRFENKWVFEEPEWVIHRIRESFGWQERTTPSSKRIPPLLCKEGSF